VRQLRRHVPFPVMVVVCAALFAFCAAGGSAAVFVGSDPTDAPSGPVGKTDLRSLAWDVGAAATVLTVSVDESTYGAGERADLGLHVLIDADRDGLADAEVTGTRNANGVSVDVALRVLDRTLSTTDCQDLAGKATSAQATVASSVASGLETFSFAFATTEIPGGLAHFRWVAYGQSPAQAALAGPWDYLPNAANPDTSAANPDDRRCGPSKGGLRVTMAAGLEADSTAVVVTHPPRVTKYFHSPTGSVRCKVTDFWGGGLNYARCQTQNPARRADLRPSGTTRICRGVSCLAPRPAAAFTLGYGVRTEVGRFRCTSMRTGMRCVVTASGHGFKINRSGITRF
jgi:hypothetical protein